MALDIRILTGARAGHHQRFEQAIIVVGRHPKSDLHFDTEKDLDVSGRHAEIRIGDSRYTLHDCGSTNGTFLNGRKVEDSVELKDGDRITFGVNGPRIEVSASGVKKTPPTAIGSVKTPANTEERVAIAVRQHTRGLQRYLVAAAALLAVGVIGAYYAGNQESNKRVAELRKLLAMNDSVAMILQGVTRESGDTALQNEIHQRIDALRKRLPAATSDAERARIGLEIAQNQSQLRGMVRMDLPSINARNAPAVALIVSEIGGKAYAGSGFAIASHGLLITNRHNVRGESGQMASRLAVKFRDRREWLPARVVKIASAGEGDLALLQLDAPGETFPVIAGIHSSGDDAAEGAPVVTIGFPLGMDTPMEGEGNDFIAKTTLNPGTVSKRTSTVLQIDSYANHGSSGSPVFSARGYVAGVVYGGATDGGGRIVYSVPPDKIAAFIPAEHRELIKD